MDNESKNSLAIIRIESADELLNDARNLLKSKSYKSANNRAFYSAEKSIKAALALKEKDSKSHSGVIHLFNSEFILNKSRFFDHDDLILLKNMDLVRTASDYDDFYLASKKDTIKQITDAEIICNKVKEYLKSEKVII